MRGRRGKVRIKHSALAPSVGRRRRRSSAVNRCLVDPQCRGLLGIYTAAAWYCVDRRSVGRSFSAASHLDDDQPVTGCSAVAAGLSAAATALRPLTGWLIVFQTHIQLVVVCPDKPAVCLIASAVRPSGWSARPPTTPLGSEKTSRPPPHTTACRPNNWSAPVAYYGRRLSLLR